MFSNFIDLKQFLSQNGKNQEHDTKYFVSRKTGIKKNTTILAYNLQYYLVPTKRSRGKMLSSYKQKIAYTYYFITLRIFIGRGVEWICILLIFCQQLFINWKIQFWCLIEIRNLRPRILLCGLLLNRNPETRIDLWVVAPPPEASLPEPTVGPPGRSRCPLESDSERKKLN